jgi:selenoprotein W-related protein
MHRIAGARPRRPASSGRGGARAGTLAAVKSRIEIRYCTHCRWLLRAAWTAQELLTTFEDEIGELALVPGSGGVFEVWAGGELLWSRAERARFPELAELKQLVRDRIAPGKALGHSEPRSG